jgi:hypothetical protein
MCNRGAHCAPLSFVEDDMRKIHTVDKGALGIAMPELKKGWIGKRVQGGHAPVPFRQHSNNLGRASVCARVPQQNVWAD